MRWLASVPFVLFMIALALMICPVMVLAKFTLRTILLIRGSEAVGPNDAGALALGHRALAFMDGHCWKCGTHVTDD